MASSDYTRLKEIDRHLEDAVNFCISSGLSPTEVTNSARPLLDWVDQKKKKRKIRSLVKFAVFFAVLAVLWESEVCYRWLCIGCKLLQLKLLPYWDWTELYNTDCLVTNPYYVDDSAVTDEDCKWVQEYADVHRLKNLSHHNMTNDYMLKNLPVIVTDATSDWLATETFSFAYLQQIYSDEEVYSDCLDCTFATSVPVPGRREFLKNIDEYDSFNTHWCNCYFQCMKSFRRYYKRPYFIPPMVGPSEQNFVIVAKTSLDQQRVAASQTLPSIDAMTWLSQIRGQLHITLKSECPGIRNIEEILGTGETVAYNNKVWRLSYKGTGEGESIALGSTGSWD